MVQFGNNKPVTLDVENLQFNIFEAEDIHKFSVCKITNSVSFNSIGNPVTGGLYDNAMGPTTRGDMCTTCLNDENNCTGHYGHIDLVMPCYNPFFIKYAVIILRASCIKCMKLQVTARMKEIVELQLKLIDAGYAGEALDLEDRKATFCNASKLSKKKIIEEDIDDTKGERVEKAYNKLLKKMSKLIKNQEEIPSKTKTTEALRLAIVHNLAAEATNGPSGARSKCLHCQMPLRRVRYSNRKIVVTVGRSELLEAQRGNLNESQQDEEDAAQKSSLKTIMANECRDILKGIFENDGDLILQMYPVLQKAKEPSNIFFMDVLPVIPPNFRPANHVRDILVEHPQTKAYHNVVLFNNQMRYILAIKRTMDGDESPFTPAMHAEAENIYKLSRGESANEKIHYKWEELQNAIDIILDNQASMNKNNEKALGIKQIIEKKEGLVRMHMMGKRVNYACRTVITPDPNIEVDSLGIPEAFALKLTYPVPVTPWNVSTLRKMVLNGPDKHPGACFIESSSTGSKRAIPREASKRELMANTLLKPEYNDGIKIVHRHLINGDVMLLNRQPTLHRPSIMAHKARILKGEKTFKLHYSNCKSYNADFDGDEMNAHLPQNEVGRSEAYNLVNVASHYLVPKDGTPLGGLIQDHMISGVKISMRGRFFNKEDYQQLVFQALSNKLGNIKLLPPTIIKPVKLWSGKQIFSTIILNIIPEGKPPINLKSTAKVGAKSWQTQKPRDWMGGGTALKEPEMSEAEVIFRHGELLVGVLDKNHYGSTPYSLIHCVYELYGGSVSTKLLSSLTRLFTAFLQWEGFTLGVHDILVQAEADKERKKIIKESRKIGRSITCQALDIPETVTDDELVEKLEEAYATDLKFRSVLDRKYKSAMDTYTNGINKACLPAGLVCKFPDNNLQLMVVAGAKGSTVNTMQISCLLGQIELEGKRPPIMINGKSLPSFPLFECSPKAGGFIDGRFMTGIEPQGFLFHCMAGREGLIDTAVKTSRSGYLQRCLIKHLEGLMVAYDGTVRDSDKTVVQFMFGEDGMDILKSQFIKAKQMEFLIDNKDAILNEEFVASLRNSPDVEDRIAKLKKRINLYQKRHGSTLQRPIRTQRNLNPGKSCPDTVNSHFSPHSFFGSISENIQNMLNKHLKSNDFDNEEEENIKNMLFSKAMQSLADPGEPVGLLAAQSIGEPSTQMTLNTFHFAGRGDMNVTLGIPRLREILMMASKNIKTPSMEIPFMNQSSDNLHQTSEKFRIMLNQVTMADMLEDVKVTSYLSYRPTRVRNYEFKFTFLPHKAYKKNFSVKPKKVFKYTHEVFITKLLKAIERASKENTGEFVEEEKETKKSKKSDDMGDEEASAVDAVVRDLKNKDNGDESSEDERMDDEDATDERRKAKQADEKDYDEPEDIDEQKDAELQDSDDEFDLTKVKLEVDEALDATKLLEMITRKENEDMEQLEKLEKEQEDFPMLNDDDIFKSLTRRTANISSNIVIKDFSYDSRKYLWCCIKFEVPVKFRNLDMTNVLRDTARTSVIWEIPKIKRAITFKQNDILAIKTEGINIEAMLAYDKILDLNKLYTNDIHAVANTYGIEAAARVIVKEVQNVFKVYGITVDPRHLSLIADYMTFDGTIQPLNRKGIESSASPLQQVSFESALQFLKSSAIQGRNDNINSPSACLMLGHPCKIGTGSFGLIHDLSYVLKDLKKN